jgi:hypothetical protein
VISGFCCEVAQNFALLGHYSAYIGSKLPTFRDSRSVQSTGVRNYHHSPRDKPEERSGAAGDVAKVLLTSQYFVLRLVNLFVKNVRNSGCGNNSVSGELLVTG